MPPRESLLDVVGLLVRRRRLWLGIVGAALVSSVLLALLLPTYYRATTSFLAASPDQSNYSKLFTGESVEMYGTGNDIERLIAAAESEATVGFLIDTFDLYAVYDIDSTSRRARSLVREEFADHYEVLRTRYSEVEISVEDRDPARAAALANAARQRCETVVKQTHLRGQRELLNMFEGSLAAKGQRLRQIADSLQLLSERYGILDVSSQAEALAGLLTETDRAQVADSVGLAELSRGGNLGPRLRDTLSVLRARIAANRLKRSSIQSELSRFAEASPRARVLSAEYEIVSTQISYERERTRQLASIIASPGPVLYVADVARVPDRKSRPVRWLIVVGTTLAAAIFGALGILLFDSYNDVEWSRYLGR